MARDVGISWPAAMGSAHEHGTPRVDDPARPAGVGALGVDETALTAATATPATSFVTGMVDLTRRAGAAARLLNVIDLTWLTS
ncbi:hypothetical protein [Pseudonocardia sp.]|uniref:hypothetical protein n=1 Tax=Pseudonocardia sp. TaxID=60912 RepID=UPI003D14834B